MKGKKAFLAHSGAQCWNIFPRCRTPNMGGGDRPVTPPQYRILSHIVLRCKKMWSWHKGNRRPEHFFAPVYSTNILCKIKWNNAAVVAVHTLDVAAAYAAHKKNFRSTALYFWNIRKKYVICWPRKLTKTLIKKKNLTIFF